MQSMRDGDFKFILHYEDHLTKFAVLRPLTSKLAAEVGFQLLDISFNQTTDVNLQHMDFFAR